MIVRIESWDTKTSCKLDVDPDNCTIKDILETAAYNIETRRTHSLGLAEDIRAILKRPLENERLMCTPYKFSKMGLSCLRDYLNAAHLDLYFE